MLVSLATPVAPFVGVVLVPLVRTVNDGRELVVKLVSGDQDSLPSVSRKYQTT